MRPASEAVLLDTSIWVQHLRNDPLVVPRVVDLVDMGGVWMCEPVAMELLSSPRADSAERLERLVNALPSLPLDAEVDFRSAARIMRLVRQSGHTVRSSVDAVIAALALRHDVAVIHDDVDFERIGDVTALRHERWGRDVTGA